MIKDYHQEFVEQLKAVNENIRAIPPSAQGPAVEVAMLRAAVAETQAVAAVALAIFNGLSDIEVALARLAEAVENS